MRNLFLWSLVSFSTFVFGQGFNVDSVRTSQKYLQLKEKITQQFKGASPGDFGPFVKGVDEDIETHGKVMALTFDACGGPNGSGFDIQLIQYLHDNHIPATLFLTGLWIDEHPDAVQKLKSDPLFEIENHGLTHHPCAIAGETKYGIHGTASVAQAVDEIELNALKIESLVGRKPIYYRSATATTDEACAAIAKYLHERIISYDLLSGDAVPQAPLSMIRNNLIHQAKPGAIVIMHMNHPEWNGFEALKEALPVWRKEGYTFIRLEDHPLKGKK